MEKRHRNPFPSSPFVGHVDIPRLREGGVTAIAFTVPAVPVEDPEARERRSRTRSTARSGGRPPYHAQLRLARTAADILEAREKGIPSFFLTLEGSHAIQCRPGGDRGLQEKRVDVDRTRVTSPSRTRRTRTGGRGGATSLCPNSGTRSSNRWRRASLIVDLAHVASRSFLDAVEHCKRPPIVSHTGFRSVKPMWRNISDYEAKTRRRKRRRARCDVLPGVPHDVAATTRSSA